MSLDTRVQLSKLEIFCRVVELQSVTRAADELFLSQPVVTSHVGTLQKRLGAKLLYREGHSMLPTEAGQLAYDWAKDVLTRSEEMSRRMEGLADGSAGHAAVAASMTVGSYMLPTVLTRFQRDRPGAQIGLDLFDPEHVRTTVESGAYDFGVLIADRAFGEGSLVFEQVGEEEFVLVTGQSSDLPDAISRRQVSRLDLVGSPHHRVREHLLSQLLTEKGIELGPPSIELGHAEAMKRVIKEGHGAAFLFESSVEEELKRGELRRIRISGCGRLPASIYLAYRSTKNFSAMQTALLDAIRDKLG